MRRLVAVLLAALLVLAAPGPARAHDGAPVVTHPVRTALTLPAGAVCAFDVRVEFPVTDLTRHTWYADGGRPVFAVETGTMIADFTAVATGRTVRRDLSGTGYYAYPDERTTILSGTRIVALLGPNDRPANRLLFSGGGFMSVRVTVSGSGTRVRTVIVNPPTAEDICATLARVAA
ncbi:hypothetical protein GCM10009558_098410 [Virgisporangium aurantiacum]